MTLFNPSKIDKSINVQIDCVNASSFFKKGMIKLFHTNGENNAKHQRELSHEDSNKDSSCMHGRALSLSTTAGAEPTHDMRLKHKQLAGLGSFQLLVHGCAWMLTTHKNTITSYFSTLS